MEDAWAKVAAFVPKLIGFLLILVLGYSIAKLIAKAADAILERVGFDKAVERGRSEEGAGELEGDGQLSQDEEARLYSHYGFDYGEQRSDSGLPEGGGTAPAAGDDDAMTRSEEELEVAKTSREAGRVRLRKWVDVERVSTTVPVAQERG